MSQGKWAEAKAGNHDDYPAQVYTVSLFTIDKMEPEVSEGDISYIHVHV